MKNKLFGVGIIGCGLIGQKRVKALGDGGEIIACADVDIKKAMSLASNENVKPFEDWKELLKLPEVEIVVVATMHDSLAKITLAALEAKKQGVDLDSTEVKAESSRIEPPFIVALKEILERISRNEIPIRSARD